MKDYLIYSLYDYLWHSVQRQLHFKMFEHFDWQLRDHLGRTCDQFQDQFKKDFGK